MRFKQFIFPVTVNAPVGGTDEFEIQVQYVTLSFPKPATAKVVRKHIKLCVEHRFKTHIEDRQVRAMFRLGKERMREILAVADLPEEVVQERLNEHTIKLQNKYKEYRDAKKRNVDDGTVQPTNQDGVDV